MKRFYKETGLEKTQEGYSVILDGKAVRTPAKHILVSEHEEIAREAMQEWAAQQEVILPHTMPVTQLLVTALDREKPREEREANILGYLNTDMLFYHASASPYKEKQADVWTGWTDWFAKKFSVPLVITGDLVEVRQHEDVKQALQNFTASLDEFSLLVFETLVEETSSYVLSAALFEKAASAEDVYGAVFVEDLLRAGIYDEDKYGAAPDQTRRRESVLINLKAAEKLISILRRS